MYQSKIRISTENKWSLKVKMNIFLQSHDYIHCKSLKRKVYLSKMPDAIINRKKSATARLKRFFVAVDILKKEKNFTKRIEWADTEYEIIGLDSNWSKVYIHLREEVTSKKDRKVYFVSCY